MNSDHDTKLVSSRLKFLAEAPVAGTWGSEPAGDSSDIRCIRAADFDRNSHRVDPSRWPLRSVEDADRHELRVGDLLIEKSGGGTTQPVGAVILFDRADRAVCSNFVARLRPLRNIDSRYLTYLHESLYRGNGTVPYVKQTTGIQNLDLSAYLGQSVSVHDPEDQPRIADFLDRETERIDALVDKKRCLIDLLEEKRTATITQAVTKGLDPTVPMKPSGIPWIGEIPAHWRRIPVRHGVSRITSGSRGWARYYADVGVPFIRITNVARDGIDLDLSDLRFVNPPDSTETRRTMMESGDVVVSITADIGSIGVIDDARVIPSYPSQHLALVSPLPMIHHRWFAYALKGSSAQAQLDCARYGGTKTQLALEDVLDIDLPLPPVDEQQQIASWIDDIDATLVATVSIAREQLSLLAEYREALITAAVTGEIDVDDFDAERQMARTS